MCNYINVYRNTRSRSPFAYIIIVLKVKYWRSTEITGLEIIVFTHTLTQIRAGTLYLDK